MGCDIHAAIEYRTSATAPWQAVMVPNPYAGRDFGDGPEAAETAQLDFGRNYDAFAILGNVRNGRGFAGIKTGDEFVPISDGRGLPDDISDAGRAACSGDHSDTWVSLAELLAYPWTAPHTSVGWVNAVEFEEWDRRRRWKAEPPSWCGGVDGQHVEKIDESEMRARIAAAPTQRAEKEKFLDANRHVYCYISWSTTCAREAGQLWTEFVPLMLAYARFGNDNVRMVMNFDS